MARARRWKYIPPRVENGEITRAEALGALEDHLRLIVPEYKQFVVQAQELRLETFDYWNKRLTEATETLAAIYRGGQETVLYRSVELKVVK